MNDRPRVPDDVLERQRKASNPSTSAWVSSIAGSGKTYVLAQRVIRLLLEGYDPAKILCLTFTKAAAANMANGVFNTLAAWTAIEDDKLDEALRAMSNTPPDPARRALARRLFALALETPGGLKVQTIHAFCTHLLHLFPFEANVAARFTVIDDVAQRQLLEQLTLAVLLEAASGPDGDLGRALSIVTTAAADQTLRDVINEAIGERDAVTRWIQHAGGIDSAAAQLARMLGIDPADSRAQVETDIVDGPIFPSSKWAAVAALCKASTPQDRKQGERLTAAELANGPARIEAYLEIFIGGNQEPRVALFTKSFSNNHPDLVEKLIKEQTRVVALRERRNAVICRDRTVALLTIAAAVIERYRVEKERRGLLDYDDLIDKTLDLLTRVEAAWVHYKLDLGIDHVLIDEAQDTSPKQWEIVKRLVSEFTAGAGARGSIRRSLFAVGDDKQSIYSFQGAEPNHFAEMRRFFDKRFKESGLDFDVVELKHSFRSAPVILDAVDKVFERPEAFKGLTADPVKTVHEAVRDKAPGLVELWELIAPEGDTPAEGWQAPFDAVSKISPRVELAQKIANSVRTWIARGDIVGDGNQRHAVIPGD
ncbi:MAG: UvrD-helicase domain-containing protein, partial [Rhizobiales bacterium]|nr:UvrD-helicase domain-containing protein [Hyphomicrobiales bacterium]